MALKLKLIIVPLLFAMHLTASGQVSKLKKEQVEAIHHLISIFKTGDKAKIADMLHYPIRRTYPLKDIRNKTDFIQRFSEIADQEFISHISKSKIDDWSEVGWRGIMLDRGIVWLDGKGKITIINYQSPGEKQLLLNAIQTDKNELPESLRNFAKPVYLINTKSYKIRIDEIADGNYRYASWKIRSKKTEPDLVLKQGTIEFQGSGGNHTITFNNNEYTYIISINEIRSANEPEATIQVLKGDKEILTENGRIKRN